MYIEFLSLIKNDIWEYLEAPTGQIILTRRCVLKIKKDQWYKFMKFKA